MKTVYSFLTFAKEIGFDNPKQKGFRKTVNHLERLGALEIQQSGFKGDNLHHSKLIVVKDFYTVFLYLGAKPEESGPKRKRRPTKSIPLLSELIQTPKIEKLHFTQFGQIRTHSRVLYIALDPLIARIHRIKKGDIIKYTLNEIRRAPDEDEPIGDAGDLNT